MGFFNRGERKDIPYEAVLAGLESEIEKHGTDITDLLLRLSTVIEQNDPKMHNPETKKVLEVFSRTHKDEIQKLFYGEK